MNWAYFIFITLCYLSSITIKTGTNSAEDWLDNQLKIKQQLLQKLPDTALKNSPFQELYLKDMIQDSANVYYVNISFNLHGFDCGAPDCFATDVSFHIDKQSLTQQVSTPLVYQASTAGCGYETPSVYQGKFNVMTFNRDSLVLQDSEMFNTLYILRNDSNQIYAYYYENVDSNYKDMMPYQSFDIDNELSIHPYMNTSLRSFEYELWMD